MTGDSGNKFVTNLPPVALMPSASAKQMATALEEFSDQLRKMADRLRSRQEGEIYRVRILLFDQRDHSKVIYHTCDCNGGGDGGG
jgi:hypothetical protein